MRKLHYHRVDVFTDRPFGGNPLAVFPNGRGIDSETMQSIAKEFNLSETTFVLPPEDAQSDWRVRIFTPNTELPMAGHPTIGTSYVLALEHLIERAGDTADITLEEGVGPVPVRIEFRDGEPAYIEMKQSLPTFGPRLSDVSTVAEMLSLEREDLAHAEHPVEVVSCGVSFLYAHVKTLDAMRRIRLRTDLYERVIPALPATGLLVFTLEATRSPFAHVHARMFAPTEGIFEDPATGSANGPLGCYLSRYGLMPPDLASDFVSEQGVEMGRPSYMRVKIEREGDEFRSVRVGGACRYMGGGFIEL